MRCLPRFRPVYAALIVATVLLGLASRRFAVALPFFVADYAGDALWATAVFFVLAFIFRRHPALPLALGALAIAFAVEFSQLYHAPWLDVVRSTRLGVLALGNGFLWSDLVCYCVGVGMGVAIDAALRRRHRG